MPRRYARHLDPEPPVTHTVHKPSASAATPQMATPPSAVQLSRLIGNRATQGLLQRATVLDEMEIPVDATAEQQGSSGVEAEIGDIEIGGGNPQEQDGLNTEAATENGGSNEADQPTLYDEQSVETGSNPTVLDEMEVSL